MNINRLLFIWLLNYLGGSFAALNVTEILPFKDDRGIITMTEENYDNISQGIAEHFTALFITTSQPNKQGIHCDICDDFEPIFSQISLLTEKQAPHAQILFVEADVTYNRKMVRDLKLSTVPHLLIFPPPANDDSHWKKSAFYQYELKKDQAKNALKFADFVAKILKVYLSVEQDFDYQAFAKYFLVCVVLFSFIKRVVLPKVPQKSKVFSGMISIGILLLSITGFKFTQINSIPFIARDPKGAIMYFSGGMGWQFGIEILTVSLMYIAMGFLTFMMIYMAKFQLDPRLRFIASTACSCGLFYMFSYYVSCFQIKNPGYPYGF